MIAKFSDGSTVTIPDDFCFDNVKIVGTDSEGDLVAESDGNLYPLTHCCLASGKGAEVSTGVVCRSCYEEVDSIYGTVYEEADVRSHLISIA
jgi:hypothetical protein